jgi:glycosyltransferase involved in cell wall biosynthesis
MIDPKEVQTKDEGSCEASGQRAHADLLYAFSYGVTFEFEAVRQNKVPTHRLWGAVELGQLGWRISVSPELPTWWRWMGTTGWRLWQTLWLLRRERNAAAIVAIHEISALLLLLIRTLGWRGAPLVVLDLGLLHPKNCAGYRHWIWGWFLRKADRVVSLVDANRSELTRVFGVKPGRTSFLPMSVDADFSGRAVVGSEEAFVLAVGTNDGKDFETLLEAMPLGVPLIIVTDSYNARKVRAHSCFGGLVEVREAVPARDLRELYRRAALVVVPLADTPHGSGHTVLLETMAMGKVVVVSLARCMKDYIGDGEAVVAVPVGDVDALREALEETLQHPERFLEMRERAAARVRSTFDIRRFGQGLDRIIGELTEERACRFLENGEHSGCKKKEGDKSYASVS